MKPVRTGAENAVEKPWRRVVLCALDVFTAVTSLLLLLLGLESLREQGRIDILAAMAGACCAYWVAARLGPRRTMDRRLAVVTLLVIAVAGWVAIA